MPIASRRGYVTQAELATLADITITDATEADDRISQAEELIDAYVGYIDPFDPITHFGEVTSSTATILSDTSGDSVLNQNDDYYKGCEIEIVGGANAGERRIITSSDKDDKSVTVSAAWTTTPDSTSAYKIYQLGKFPRPEDVYSSGASNKYYKSIPEEVKRATAFQVEYMINQGQKFFGSDAPDMRMEQIGNYKYEKGSSSLGDKPDYEKLIGPRARAILRGIRSITGTIV